MIESSQSSASSHASYIRQLQAAAQFIHTYDDFLVVSHVSPDGDAVSSTCTVGWLLSQFNKKFILINEGRTPDKFNYLPYAEQIVDFSNSPQKEYSFKAIISVDCADYKRIGKVAECLNASTPLLNIDHHPTNDSYGAVQLLRFDAAATVQILFDLIEYMEVPLTPEAASCIYTGLLTDTGGFRYSNTTASVMECAMKLLKQNINGHEIAERVLETITVQHIVLLKKALLSLSFSADQQVAWISVTAEDFQQSQALQEDLEGLVNYPRNIEGVKVGLLFKEMSTGEIKVSLRSAGKTNVALIAQSFGGGGHMRAAGCTIQDRLDRAIAAVVSKVEESLV